MTAPRSRYQKTPSQLAADKAVSKYRGEAMQRWTVQRLMERLNVRLTDRRFDRLADDDVDAWCAVLFPRRPHA